MTGLALLPWIIYLVVLGAAAVAFLVVSREADHLRERLQQLEERPTGSPDRARVAQLARLALPRLGAALTPDTEEAQARLQKQLVHAGFYQRSALTHFLGVKVVLLGTPWIMAALLLLFSLVPWWTTLMVTALLSGLGLVGPSFWLDWRKATRQRTFRRTLPDLFDVLIICLEGGLGLVAALKRVGAVLSGGDSILGRDLSIVEREVQLGAPLSEALLHFAERTDLDELFALAGTVEQSERLGSGLIPALRCHADTLRQTRLHQAEEKAQQASVKVLFPTLLFIFPGIFVILLAPAAYQAQDLLRVLNSVKVQQVHTRGPHR